MGIRQYQCGRKNCLLAVVCKGTGGTEAGEQAGSFTVNGLLSSLEPFIRKGGFRRRDVKHYFFRKICQIHMRIADCFGRQEICTGTSLSMALLLNRRVYLFYTENSRIYAGIRHLRLQTSVHGKKRKRSRALGTGPFYPPCFKTLPFVPGEKLLLCSDGFDRNAGNLLSTLCRDYRKESDIRHDLLKIYRAARKKGERDSAAAVLICGKRGGKNE